MIHLTRARGRVAVVGAILGSLGLVATMTVPTSGAATRPHSVTGVTAHQILLGATTPLTGPASPGYDEIAPATQAVFDYINAHGGVYGRKIKYIIDNDEYDPQLTVSYTKQLVQQDGIFADVGSLGTPTQAAVQQYLNANKVPQLFVESGCGCWSIPKKYPDSFGWQPNYIVEGKILGRYTETHFKGKKIGYLYQDDEFGLDGVKGLNQEIPRKQVVSEQNYQGTSQGLANGLGVQIGKLKAAHAKVVVLYTIPAATALALLAAAQDGYSPQWVVSSVGADPPTVSALLKSFSKGKAGGALMNGMISNGYLPRESDGSNAWNKLSKSILKKYDKSYKGWDGNTEYGAAVGYTTVEMLLDAGKHLTRAGLLKTLETKASNFAASGIVPFTYSKSSHYGFSGSEIVRINNLKLSKVSPVYVSTYHGPIKVYKGGQKPIPSIFKKH